MEMDGATIIATIGDGISAGTIGATAFGSLTITIHGTILMVTTDITIMVITTMATTISVIIEDVLIHILTDKEGGDIETPV